MDGFILKSRTLNSLIVPYPNLRIISVFINKNKVHLVHQHTDFSWRILPWMR